MRTATTYDEHAITRTGAGLVTAVVPVGTIDADGIADLYRVEIAVIPPSHRPNAIRYSIHAHVVPADPIYPAAMIALYGAHPHAWTMRWIRNDGVPADIPVHRLNMFTQMQHRLLRLELLHIPTESNSAPPSSQGPAVPARELAAML